MYNMIKEETLRWKTRGCANTRCSHCMSPSSSAMHSRIEKLATEICIFYGYVTWNEKKERRIQRRDTCWKSNVDPATLFPSINIQR